MKIFQPMFSLETLSFDLNNTQITGLKESNNEYLGVVIKELVKIKCS